MPVHIKGVFRARLPARFVESILSKMPIFLAFVVLSGFAAGTLTGQTCLYVGLGLAAAVLVQMLVHYLSDSLQSAAGYLMLPGSAWSWADTAETAHGLLYLRQYRQNQFCPQHRYGVY